MYLQENITMSRYNISIIMFNTRSVLFLQEKTIKLSSKEDLPPLRNPDILVGENDLTSLSYLHEPAGE